MALSRSVLLYSKSKCLQELLKILTKVSILSVVIYNIKFHPLAKYPGPFLAKFTNIYAAYHGWIGDTHLDAERCHKKYGKIIKSSKIRAKRGSILLLLSQRH